MTEPQSHKLANIARQELKRQALRRDILVSDSQKALDMILEAPSPATLIQSFPDQDLYYLMHKIGIHDFTPVLALANSKQWEYILDVEVWDDDRLDTTMMTQVFAQLFKADPKRLLRWAITEKPDFLEFFLLHNMSIVVREHDEFPPSDFDDYITLDDKFYFRFPDKTPADDPEGEILPAESPEDHMPHEEAPELIENMLKALAQMDLSVFHGLMLETPALLPAETEEEQFRLKNIRLAEKGFLPPHEAVGIYQPVRTLKKRPKITSPESEFDPDIPQSPQCFTQFISGDTLFAQALSLVEASGTIIGLDNELAALLNKIISADRVKIRTRDTIKKIMGKAMAFMSLGLEVILKEETVNHISVEAAAGLIQTYFLEDLFRTGSKAGIQLRTRAKNWYGTSFLEKNNLPLSFLGESYLGVIGGLMIQRPMFFANYADKELYRHFNSLADIRATDRLLTEIISLDEFLGKLSVDMGTFTLGVLTYKSMILTLWARQRMGLDQTGTPSLAPIPIDKFLPFFTDLFEGHTQIEDQRSRDLALWAAKAIGVEERDLPVALQGILYGLIRELEEEYGNVRPERIDPRFMPLFLLAGTKGKAGNA